MTLRFWQMLFEVSIFLVAIGAIGIGIGVAMVKAMQWLERD